MRVRSVPGVLLVLAFAILPMLSLARPCRAQVLSQDDLLARYARIQAQLADAKASGNPIIEREGNEKLAVFWKTAVVNGARAENWTGLLTHMDLDHSGRILYCAVDISHGTGLPEILVTNYDIASGKIGPLLGSYRTLRVGEAVRISGTIRKPIRYGDYVKALPGGELAFGDLNEWGIIASAVSKVTLSPAAKRLMGRLDALPSQAESVRAALDEYLTLKKDIETRTDLKGIDWWRQKADADPEFREAYEHLVDRAPPTTTSYDPFDYVKDKSLAKPVKLRVPKLDQDTFDELTQLGDRMREQVRAAGDVSAQDPLFADLNTRLQSLDTAIAELHRLTQYAKVLQAAISS